MELKITPISWGQKFLHIDTFQKKTIAGPYPPTGKQDKSLHDFNGQWANPNFPQLRLSPRKYQKKESANTWVF